MNSEDIIGRSLKERETNHKIEPLFVKRWSPRAMSGEEITQAAFFRLLEAARWAPSTYNVQEWRYLYAARSNKDAWDKLFDLLVEANQNWAKNASYLILISSYTKMDDGEKKNPVHSFDTGASFQNFCLQGAAMNLVVHGMAGFDQAKAREVFSIAEDYNIEAMVAVGQPAAADSLPAELQKREEPSGRKTISEFSSNGVFTFEEAK
jgi:nitroreductase